MMLRGGLMAAVAVAVMTVLAVPPAAAQNLDASLGRIAAAWHRADAAAITALGARAGISIDVDGSSVGPLGPRQAAAVLRRVFDNRESVSVRTSLNRPVGGDPPRAFGEMRWEVRSRGTTIPESAKLFIALVREDDRWAITEIRILK